MNTIKSHKLLSTIAFAICLLFSAGTYAHGWGGGSWHGGGWHGGGWHGGGWGGGFFPGVIIGPGLGYYGPQCGIVGGYRDAYGYWIPPHRACW